jgi:ABC-2 type transport system ATP-binding protein
MSVAPALRVSGLARRFGEVEAVRVVSFEIARGEVFGLVGPDGAGKTTTLRMLCGLLDPDAGEREICGLSVVEKPDEVRDRIGYMAQKFGLYGDLSVEENMDFYADLFGVAELELGPLKERLLEMTRMTPFRDRLAAKLSGGMKQKLSLMCTLLHKPELLILDEPTNGVDPLSRRDFWLILEELVREGMSVLVATAYLDEAERCHRVAMMYQGRLILVDTPAALRNNLPESCFAIRGESLRDAQEALRENGDVADAQLSGAELHVLMKPGAPTDALDRLGRPYERIQPKLEDVFIAEIRRARTAA